jgi:acyl carrier protein
LIDNISKEIISIIAEVSGFKPTEIKRNTNFGEKLEIDSIKAIEITVAIEKSFGISIRNEDVPNITTVNQAVLLTEKLLKEKSSSVMVDI